mmetsp:Transcript_3889/g.5782  ORF Transcript_3889/g.5782 Transcript_3889/m.5782 type:complete len:230 (+) Transcript_3889:259-948(+)
MLHDLNTSRSIISPVNVNIPKFQGGLLGYCHFVIVEYHPPVLLPEVAHVVAGPRVLADVADEPAQRELARSVLSLGLLLACPCRTRVRPSGRPLLHLGHCGVQVVRSAEEPVRRPLQVPPCGLEGGLGLLLSEPHGPQGGHCLGVSFCSPCAPPRGGGSGGLWQGVVEVCILHVLQHPVHRHLCVGVGGGESGPLAPVFAEAHGHQGTHYLWVRLLRGCCCLRSSIPCP